MTMLLITAVVERLMLPVNLLLIWLNNTMGHLYSPFSLRLFHLGLVSQISEKFRKFLASQPLPIGLLRLYIQPPGYNQLVLI